MNILRLAIKYSPVKAKKLLKRISERIEHFHNEFEEKGITKPFKEELFYWSYEQLKESERIAGILSSRILKQKNE